MKFQFWSAVDVTKVKGPLLVREYVLAAVQAFDDLDAPEVIILLAQAPDPDRAERLSESKIGAAFR